MDRLVLDEFARQALTEMKGDLSIPQKPKGLLRIVLVLHGHVAILENVPAAKLTADSAELMQVATDTIKG